MRRKQPHRLVERLDLAGLPVCAVPRSGRTAPPSVSTSGERGCGAGASTGTPRSARSISWRAASRASASPIAGIMPERLAVIAAVSVVAVMTMCAACCRRAGSGPATTVSYHSPAARWGMATVVSFLDGISGSGFWVRFGCSQTVIPRGYARDCHGRRNADRIKGLREAKPLIGKDGPRFCKPKVGSSILSTGTTA